MSGSRFTTLFVLAHPDDEIPFASIIESLKARGASLLIAYLTSGDAGPASAHRRQSESTRVLARLGVTTQEIYFLGNESHIADGFLHTRLDDVYSLLKERATASAPIERIYTLAWEGGHQDHDSAHAIAVYLAHHLNLLKETRQLSFYRASDILSRLPTVSAPLPANGAVSFWPSTLRDRLRILALVRFYPSQLKTWLVLIPLYIARLFCEPRIALQPVSFDRLRQRPNKFVWYELRGFAETARVMDCIGAFLKNNSGLRPTAPEVSGDLTGKG
jgi:LmbE family N-acetylglucosaminyl deacetylase